MKTRLFTLFLLFTVLTMAVAGGTKDATDSRSNEVVIYAYDSFVSDWGPGPAIVEAFEKATGYKVTMISAGDAAQVLSKAVVEKKNPQADILIGIDNQLVQKAITADILSSYKPANADSYISKDIILDENWNLTPYDWSTFAMMFDTECGLPAPASLADLTKPIYKNKVILMDPRTSTPGLGFVAWTLAVYGKDGYIDYWKALKSNILTMAPGWDTGYGLFTAGEAPLVISYTTSAPYHVMYDETDRYVALNFEQGHTFQIEGVGLVKGAKNEKGAKAFIDFIISEEAQNIIPTTQWMYPANKNVVLPECYDVAPIPATTLSVNYDELNDAVNAVMTLLAQ